MRQATKRTQVNKWREQINQRLREGFFILLSSIAIYVLISLVTYHPNDPGWSHKGMETAVLNLAGRTGAFCSDILFSLFGYIAYLFPAALVFIGSFIYKPQNNEENRHPVVWSLRGVGFVFTLIASCGLAGLHVSIGFQPLPMNNGGVIGALVGQGMVSYLNPTGATVILCSLFLIGITLFTGFSWIKLADKVAHMMWIGGKNFRHQCGIWFQKTLRRAHKIQLPVLFNTNFNNNDKSHFEEPDGPIITPPPPKPKSAPVKFQSDVLVDADLETLSDDQPSKQSFMKKFAAKNLKRKNKAEQSKAEQLKEKTQDKVTKSESKNTVSEPGEHHFPSLSLLAAENEAHDAGFSADQLEQLSALVETRLKEFGVDVKVVGVQPGPVVTRFELDLAAGVKVSKITGLAKDLARSLSVVSVRVVEIIPGKSLVGLEIPNVERETVRLKEILADPCYQQSKSPVTIALGKDISGRPVVADLAKMPHLLVAGTTGSGKSVGLNAMLLSILYKADPKEVRMILIDPKMLELAVYDNIPHLLTPVVTDVKDAANALRWCVAEMEHRYQLMAALGVRNILGYNDRVNKAIASKKPLMNPLWHPSQSDKPDALEPLPYIVVLIDEFADMMMVVGKKVEEYIARLAQKARAAGVHLILATQRPSVDVITGLIKANIPTRIAFQVSSRIDSRTILDQSGAEQLLGHGDMLFLPPGVGICQRIHGAFVSDDEVHNVTEELRKLAKPDYIESVVTSAPGSDEGRMGDGEYDELYDKAVAIVVDNRKASISLVQRKLKIGYNRAARLVEMMESEGIVSQVQSNGTREVLVQSLDQSNG